MRLASRLSCLVAALTTAALGSTPAFAWAASPQQPTSRVQRAADSVVEVVTRDAGGRALAKGIGFFTDIGRLLVDGRLLRRAWDAIIRRGDRESKITAVIGEDPKSGLVLLAVDLPDGSPPSLPPGEGAGRTAAEVGYLLEPGGVRSVAVGEPRDLPSLGLVSMVTGAAGATSGSPVVDGEGRLLGLVLVHRGSREAATLLVPSLRLAEMRRVVPRELSQWDTGDAAPPEGVFIDGVMAALVGKDAVAAERFRAAAVSGPGSADTWCALARAERALNHVEESVAAYRQAIRSSSSAAALHHELGALLLERHRAGEAVAEFREAARLRPDSADARFNLGYATGQAGQPQEAYAHYRAALVLDPAHFRSLKNLGVVCLVLNRLDEAIESSSRALQLSPADAEVATNLGAAYFDVQDYTKAQDAFSRALRFRPDFGPAHFGLGTVHLLRGNRAGALAESEALRPLDSDKSEQLRRLAEQMK